MRRSASCWLLGCLALSCASAVAAGAGSWSVPDLAIADTDGPGVAVEARGLQIGDRLEVRGPVGARPPVLAAGTWDSGSGPGIDDSEWIRRVRSAGSTTVRFDDVGAGRYVVILRRVDPATGDELQLSRTVGRSSGNGPSAGPVTVVRVRHMLRLTMPAAGSVAGLPRDDAGRVHVRRSHPRAAVLAGHAVAVEPYVEARATGRITDSVYGSTGYNADFSSYLCSQDGSFGSFITISGAPAGATVTSLDVTYDIYYEHDSDRFRAELWHGSYSGGTWSDWTVLYSGTSPASDWYNGSNTGVSAYNGDPVNMDYLLAGCSLDARHTGIVDAWTITIYYGSGGSADLVADSVSLLRGDVAAGSEAGVFYEGHVGGSGDVGTSTDTAFYLSSDANITTGDRRLETRTESDTLSAGDTFGALMFEHVVSIPGDVTPGGYYLGVRLDDGEAVAEPDEDNNTAAASFTVLSSSQQPNMVASQCSVSPGQADPGDTVTLQYRARNTGGSGTPSFNWAAFLSTDADFDSGDTLLQGLDVIGGWPAGYDSGTSSVDVQLPGSLADGSYYIGMVFDPADAINETNETDNWCASQMTVGSGGGTGATDWIIPAGASTPGYGTSDWRTEVSIVNPDTAAHTADLYYVAKGQSWPGTHLTGPISLDPGESAHLVDPLAGLNPTSGVLFVDCDSAGVVVTSRTYNLAGGGATFGQGIPAMDYDGGCPGEMVLPLVHSVPGEFHTNLGLVNADGGSVTWQVTVYSSTGAQLATKSYTRSQAFEQVNDVFGDMGIGGISVRGAWVRVEVTSGCPWFWTTYASVVDDRTGDPTYVLPVAVP